jgi:hypothetical protein
MQLSSLRSLILVLLAGCKASEVSTSTPSEGKELWVDVRNYLDVDVSVGGTVVKPNGNFFALPVRLPIGTKQVQWVSLGQPSANGARLPDDLSGATAPLNDYIEITSNIGGQRYFSPRISQLFGGDTISFSHVSSSGTRCLGWQSSSEVRWGYYLIHEDSRLLLHSGTNCAADKAVAGWTTAQLQQANALSGLLLLRTSGPYRVNFTLTPNPLVVPVGGAGTLVLKQTDERGRDLDSFYSVTWSSSNPAVATVTSNGLVTGVSVGSATVTAANGPRTASVPITVREPTPSRINICDNRDANICMSSSLVPLGTSLILRAEALDGMRDISDRCNFAWRSSNPTMVAIVPSSNARTAVITRQASGGSVTIFAECSGVLGVFQVL